MAAAVPTLLLVSCSTPGHDLMASCRDYLRLALVAQSVPTASYLPCLAALPAAWSVESVEVRSGGTRLELLADRAEGRSVVVQLSAGCNTSGATGEPPPAPGVHRYLRLQSITPRYVGTRVDAFSGGCVSYHFDFPRGDHIVLLAELATVVGLQSRREVRRGLRDALGRDLDP